MAEDDFREYDLVIGFNVQDISTEEVTAIKEAVTSKYRGNTDLINATVDMTCQHVWYNEELEDSPFYDMGFDSLLFIGFNTHGWHELHDKDETCEYNLSVVLLDDQFRQLEQKVIQTMEKEDDTVTKSALEYVLVAPKDGES